jgi:ribosome biogenesis GTPase / thiamine phosphate phosphatase
LISNRRGTIVAAFGRHYEIELSDGSSATGYPLGKKSIYTCGDEVELSGDGQILTLHPRRTLLYRADGYREKLIASNVTQLILVVATEPSFSDALLTRALVAAEHEGMQTLIVLNKCDLASNLDSARLLLAPLIALGYRVIEMCAKQDVSILRPLLHGHVSVLVGQSGMGKSTLTNALIPGATAATREVSVALDSGKHTTTHARLYRLPVGAGNTPSKINAALIDCPGLQEFGLSHLTPAEIGHGFLEFRSLLGQCRFRDCQHRSEPGCAIKTAIDAGTVHPRRLEHFHQLVVALGKSQQ